MIIYALLKKRSFILDETAVALVRLVHKITYLKLILKKENFNNLPIQISGDLKNSLKLQFFINVKAESSMILLL